MRIVLASPRGFCAGVITAIRTVEEAIRIVGTPLYVYHEIVHNRHVVRRFQDQGVVFVDRIEDVPAGATVIFSAHGVSPAVRESFQSRGCTVIDATCPLVTRVHRKAANYARQGYRILLIGHAGHDEVAGTLGEAPEAITVIQSVEDVERLPFEADAKLAYLTQTTLSKNDAELIVRAVKQRFPAAKAPERGDICYATTNRQEAVEGRCANADLVLVVGSQNSSNSQRLAEIARNTGTTAHLVDDVSELEPLWFDQVETVVVTAGASAPEELVEQIVDTLVRSYDGVLEPALIVEEDMRFELPRSLRALGQGRSG